MLIRLAMLATVLVLAPAVRAADVDPHLPPDTDRYLMVNLKQILTSKAGKKLGTEAIEGALAALTDSKALLEKLGVDPLKDVETIQLAGPNSNDADRGLMIVTGTFDADKLKKKADDAREDVKPAVKAHKAPLGNKEFHPVYELEVPGVDGPRFVAFLENKTLLVSGGKDYVVDALKQARAKKPTSLKDKQVQAVIEKLDAKLGVAVVTRGGALPQSELLDLVPKNIRDALDSVEVIGGGVAFSNEVRFDLVGTCKTSDDAATLRNISSRGVALAQIGLKLLGNDNKYLTLLTEVFDTAKVGGKDKIITVSAKLSADVLDDFGK